MKNLFLALRKVLFWAHLVAGVVIGLIILVMAVTGTLMSFERQITEAANGFRIIVPTGAEKLGAEELLAALKATDPAAAAPNSITIRHEADAPVAFQYGREKTLFADPYTGRVLGEGAKKTRAFFQFVNGLHRWLALQGTAKDLGQGITSAAALVFFFMILSGLYLWIPKRWTRKGIKAISTFQGSLKGRARDWNWHNVLGIWFSLPLLVISTTGVIMAYPWANRAMFALVGEQPPPPRGQEGDKPAGGGEGRPRREGAEAVADSPRREGDDRPRGEGRRHREGGDTAAIDPSKEGSSAEAPRDSVEAGGDRLRGEGRRHREGGDTAAVDPSKEGGSAEVPRDSAEAGGDRPRGEGRRHREGGGGDRPEGGMARREGGGGGGRGPQAPAVWPASTDGWNSAFAAAEGVSAGWQSIQLQMPRGAEGVFSISDSHRGRPDLRQSVTVDLTTAAIVKVEKFDSQSLGRRLRNWVRWIHTGEAGGWLGQIVAALSTIAAVVLVWTGFALSWRRLMRWRAGRKQAVGGE